MKTAPWLALLRGATLVALAASAALFIDYTSLNPAFCGGGSGCAEVRRSGFGYWVVGESLVIPLPALGLLGFALLFSLSLAGGGPLGRALSESLRTSRFFGGGRLFAGLSLLAAGFGGIAALGLLLLQGFKLGVFCSLCVVTDVAALVAALGAFFHYRREAGAPRSAFLGTWSWVWLATLFTLAPVIWPRVRPQPPLPQAVLALHAPGKLNVVEFADFECPFCRRLHGVLEPLLASYGDRVHFIRLQKPLDSHEYARPAARAALCAERLGQGEAMANALFTTEDLREEALARLSEGLGLDPKAFAGCLADPAIEARIRRESGLLSGEDFEGLPTTFIGGRKIVGAQPEPVFREALEAAARGDDQSGVPGPVYVGIVLLLAVGVAFAGRVRGSAASPAPS